MGISLPAIVTYLLSDAAVFAATAIAYVEIRRATARMTPRTQQLAVGGLLGLAALISIVMTPRLLPDIPVNAGSVAAALAAPFGGVIAAGTVALTAVASLLWLAEPATDIGVAEVLVGTLAGLAVVEGLRREPACPGPLHVLLLAGLVPAGCLAVIGLSNGDLAALSGTTVLSLAVILPSTVLVTGLLLLRSDEREARAAAMARRFKALTSAVSGILVQIAVKRSGEVAFPYLSPEAVRLLGVMAGEAKADASKVLDVVHTADRDAFLRSLSDAARATVPWSNGFRIVQPGGRIRWLRGHLPAHLEANGDVVFDGALVDVTRSEETETALRWNEELNRFVFENASEIIARIGADDRWSYMPPSVRHILGYDPTELLGQPALSLVHPEEAGRVREALRSRPPGSAPLVTTYRARTRDGLYVWIEETRRTASGAGPRASSGSISVMRRFDGRGSADSSTVLHLPQRRGGRKGRFARMVEATSAGVLVSDPHRPDNPITFVNAAAVAITGYEAAELSGRNARILQGPGTDRATIAEIGAALHAERPVSATLLNYRKDGTPFWSKLRISPVHGADGQLEAFVCVFFEVTEEKRAEEALRQARDVAEQANRAKSEFIANISHELRTPLNGVIGFTNLLLNENLPAEQRRYATFARDAGSSLLAIINNVLDLSKIEAGKLEISETDFSVIELAVSCNTVVWHAAREKGLDLNFVLKPDVMNVCRGDPDRIRQVLLNFLSNAIKFTEKGNVVLTIAKVEDRPPGTVLMLSVTDTGLGIPKEKQELLFQKFSQVDEERSRQLGGTGLGLAICKSLVERMGGEIGVKSTPGVGSKFWFTVPLKPALGPGYRPSKTVAGPHRRARILLAEDTPMNQELMVTLLKRAGHDVTVVADGVAALEAVKQQAFDLILMDVQMARMNGLEATKAIRALDGGMSKVPIVAMTARALSKDVDECIAAGMDDHLSKPIDTVALLAVIDHWARPPEPLRQPPPHQPAAAEAAPVPQLHDETVLAGLERHVGMEGAAKMIAMAYEDIPARLARMRDNLSDRAIVGQEAHDLVAIAGNLGFNELAAQSRKLMTACSAPERPDIAEIYAAVMSTADRTMAIIEALHRAAEARPLDGAA